MDKALQLKGRDWQSGFKIKTQLYTVGKRHTLDKRYK